jgi:hypothetical protein
MKQENSHSKHYLYNAQKEYLKNKIVEGTFKQR